MPNVFRVIYSYVTFGYSTSTPVIEDQPPSVFPPSYVGPKVPMRPEGIEGAEPIAALVAYKIRNVYPEGFEATDMRYRITLGNPGMSVRRWTAAPGVQTVVPLGTDTYTPPAVPGVYNRHKFVYGSPTFTSARVAVPDVADA